MGETGGMLAEQIRSPFVHRYYGVNQSFSSENVCGEVCVCVCIQIERVKKKKKCTDRFIKKST